MRANLALVMAFAVLLAGCAARPEAPPAPTEEAPAGFGKPVRALQGCRSFQSVVCFEPWVASGPGSRLVALAATGDGWAFSADDGATFERRPPPPPPAGAPAGAQPGDTVLQYDSKGRLWWHALHYDASGAGGQLVAGLWVARSDDDGATWPANRYLALAKGAAEGVVVTDRNWLATTDGDTAYLSYWQVATGGFIARSDDAGATWSDFRPFVTTAQRRYVVPPGAPVVLPAGGAVVVPYFAEADLAAGQLFRAQEVRIAVSSDRGATFQERLVHRAPGGTAYAYWPDVVVDPNGRLILAWAGTQGQVWVTVSADGGAQWSTPVRWNAPEGVADFLPPAVRVHADRVFVAWYERSGGSRSIVAGWGTRDGPDGAVVLVENLSASRRLTDFAAAAVTEDGRAVVAWTDGDEALWVAAERRGRPPGA